LLTATLFAQQRTCDGIRYVNEVFSNFDITTGVQYGQNTTIAGNQKDLFMDIYEPNADTTSLRPAIVFVHGGAFIGGQRQNMDFLCETFARRGFVAVTIDYRLIDGLVFDSTDIADVVIKAVGDFRAAVRFLREDAATQNLYRIDPNYVFGGGTSAGGVTASNSAVLDPNDPIPSYIQQAIDNNGGFEGNSSGNTQYSSEIQGLLNYSGSVSRAQWFDSDSPPFYSAHDEFDPVVPYGYGNSNAFPFPLFSYGSAEMRDAGNALGITNELFTVPNSPLHVSYFGNATSRETVIQESAELLEDILCLNTTTGLGDPMLATSVDLSMTVYPNPSNSDVNLSFANLTGRYQVDIYNVLGMKVYEGGGESERYSINTNRFASGIYFVQVRFDNLRNQILRQKLYIQK
ncbi:MAG: T9SS type A sorting domain-containing protein, partial [Calditrichota bacterium]